MIIFDKKLNFFYSSLINNSSFFSAFSTRKLGDGREVASIFRFLHKVNLFFKKIIILDQIHSANIVVFRSVQPNILEKVIETDGIITKEKNVVLVVRTADCLPLIYVEKKKGIIGISHNGWRGSFKKVTSKMIDRIENEGGNIANIIVAIGPGINSCCYQIPEDRYYQFLDEFGNYSKKMFSFRKGKIYFCLNHFNYFLLINKGVKKDNIDFFPFCTFCQKRYFFSFRREKKKGLGGEMFNLIIRKTLID